jgi:hypothetical protein
MTQISISRQMRPYHVTHKHTLLHTDDASSRFLWNACAVPTGKIACRFKSAARSALYGGRLINIHPSCKTSPNSVPLKFQTFVYESSTYDSKIIYVQINMHFLKSLPCNTNYKIRIPSYVHFQIEVNFRANRTRINAFTALQVYMRSFTKSNSIGGRLSSDGDSRSPDQNVHNIRNLDHILSKINPKSLSCLLLLDTKDKSFHQLN